MLTHCVLPLYTASKCSKHGLMTSTLAREVAGEQSVSAAREEKLR